MLPRVDAVFRFRGRAITATDVAQIRALVAAQPAASRSALARQVCELWQWRQPNGVLRDGVCRSLLVLLHRAGHIDLPPGRIQAPSPERTRRPPPLIQVDTTPVQVPLRALRPLEFRQVRRTPEEPLCHSLLAQYHYLGHVRPVANTSNTSCTRRAGRSHASCGRRPRATSGPAIASSVGRRSCAGAIST